MTSEAYEDRDGDVSAGSKSGARDGAVDEQALAMLSSPIALPCGKVVPNRLVKAPMEEALAKLGGSPPNELHYATYRKWADGDWGMIITGNISLDPTHLGLPFDITFDPAQLSSPTYRTAWSRYAHSLRPSTTSVRNGEKAPLAVVQICHAGRQSVRGMGRAPWSRPQAPSVVPMKTGEGLVSRIFDRVTFNTPREMTEEDIRETVQRFALASWWCKESGFDGVQLHCSHGYLLAQFLSPLTNRRTDDYGGTPRKRIRIVLEIITAVRKRCGDDFVVGVKLNSADYVAGGLTEEDALDNVRWLAEDSGVDFVEISGGTYENPVFISDGPAPAPTSAPEHGPSSSSANGHAHQKGSTKAREAFFADFAARARAELPEGSKMAIMLTGGFRTRTGMTAALGGGTVDLIGVGRPAAIRPDLPRAVLLNADVADEEARAASYVVRGEALARRLIPTNLVGAGLGTLWHCAQMLRFATGRAVDVDLHAVRALLELVFCTGSRSLPHWDGNSL